MCSGCTIPEAGRRTARPRRQSTGAEGRPWLFAEQKGSRVSDQSRKTGEREQGRTGDPSCRIVGEHASEKVQRLVVHFRQGLVQRLRSPSGERRLEIWHGGQPRPNFGSGGTEKSVDASAGEWGRWERWKTTTTHRNILKISSISESPGKRGIPDAISAKMVPQDHTSTYG